MSAGFLRKQFGGIPLAVAIRVAGRGLSFLLALVLARELGLEGFGVYTFATTWVALLLIISGLGYGGLLLRQTAVFVERGQPELLLGLIHTARRTVIPLAAVLVAVAAIVAAIFFDPIFLVPLLIALPTVMVRSSSVIWEGVLRGLGRVDESFVPTFLIYPLVMLAGVGLLVAFSVSLTPQLALALYLLSFTMGALAAWLLARRRLRPVIGDATRRIHPEEGRFQLLAPFTVLAMLGTVSSGLGLVMLGLLDLPDAVGVLQVALKLTEPMFLIFAAVNLSLSARLATLYAGERLDEARPVIARAVRWGFLGSIPIALILVLAPDFLLGLFGAGFEEAKTSLFILVPACLFSVFAGTGGAALMMSDHQRVAIAARLAGLLANFGICLALIPDHGASAAALALAVDIVIVNTVSTVMAWRLLGLNTTALPFPRGRVSGSGTA